MLENIPIKLSHSLRFFTQHINKRLGMALVNRLPRWLIECHAVVEYRHSKMEVNTAESTGKVLFFLGRSHEVAQENLFLASIRKDMVVFDIGANMGIYSLMAAQKGCSVVAFEPARSVIRCLKHNIRMNMLNDKISVVERAVSDRPGLLPFYESRHGKWGVGRVFSFGQAREKKPDYTVEARPLDALVEEYGRPDIVKMDIEGAEWLALRGAKQTLSCCEAPDLFIEFHPDEINELGGAMERCIDIIMKSGYRVVDHINTDGSHHWYHFSKK